MRESVAHSTGRPCRREGMDAMTTRSPIGRIRAAACATLLALAVGGCGGSDATQRPDTLSPQAAIAKAVDQAEQVASSRFALTSTTKAGGQTIEFGGEGAFDYDATAGEMTFSLPGGGGELRQRVLDGVMYLQLPQEPDVFYRLKLSDVVDTSLGGSTDPTAGLQALRGAGKDVTEVGRETIRDAETTHYRGTLDVKKALDAVKGPLRAQLEQVLASSDVDTAPFDAWIDDEGRLRQLDQTLTIANPQAPGQSLEVSTRLELYDFGVEVDVEAPPADAVKDGAPLLEALRGGLGS